MKKLISLVLALMLVFSLATVAFATGNGQITVGDDTHNDMSTVVIRKTYTVTNSGTSYPTETFKFAFDTNYTVENGGVGSDSQGMPSVSTVTFNASEGTTTKDVTITLPTYTAVGIYTYTLREKTPSQLDATKKDTAGVVYHNRDIKLVVTVVQDTTDDELVRVAAVHTEEIIRDDDDNVTSTKTNSIENVYNAGKLEVKKVVEGVLGDRNAYFPIDITLTGENNKDYSGNVISVRPTSYSLMDEVGNVIASNPATVAVGGTYTFYLKHDETLTLENIPYGVTYTVVEKDEGKAGHTDTYDYDADGDTNNETVLKIDDAADKVVITNTKTGQIDTGITLDSLPFVLILAVCAGAAVLFVIKRRNSVEF